MRRCYAPKRWAAERAKLDALVLADCLALGATEHEQHGRPFLGVPSAAGPIEVCRQWLGGKPSEWLEVRGYFADYGLADKLGLPTKILPTYMFRSMREGVTAEDVFSDWQRAIRRAITEAEEAVAKAAQRAAAREALASHCQHLRAAWVALQA